MTLDEYCKGCKKKAELGRCPFPDAFAKTGAGRNFSLGCAFSPLSHTSDSVREGKKKSKKKSDRSYSNRKQNRVSRLGRVG